MKILHVLSLWEGQGAYGGPGSVAIAQSVALRKGADTVDLVAGRILGDKSNNASITHSFVARSLIPGGGMSGLFSLKMVFWLLSNVRRYDIVHVHLSRDLITIPASIICLLLRRRLVVQTHGMVDASRKWLSVPLDLVATRRILRSARICLCLNAEEVDDLVSVARSALRTGLLANGIDEVPFRESDLYQPPVVLYLARLHERKRPVHFVEMAAELLNQGVIASFKLVGPDEGEAKRVVEAIGSRSGIEWVGAVSPSDVIAEMQNCAVYVLPAVDEPFGLTVLEAMASGRPVVVTKSCGLADLIDKSHAGFVVEGSVDSLVSAVGRLLAAPDLRYDMGGNGLVVARDRLSMNSVTTQLREFYTLCIDKELS